MEEEVEVDWKRRRWKWRLIRGGRGGGARLEEELEVEVG